MHYAARRILTAVFLLSLASCATTPSPCPEKMPQLSAFDGHADIETGFDPRAEAYLKEHSLAGLDCWDGVDNATAQYLLGYAYENGLGVPVDTMRALQYYMKAARPGRTPKYSYVYSAPVGKESFGRVIPVLSGYNDRAKKEFIAASRRLGDILLNNTDAGQKEQ